MVPKKMWIPLFAAMVLVQLFVPLKMVFDSEAVIDDGAEFKLKTQPYDPKDPFRGNYVRLNFEISRYTAKDTTGWDKGSRVYLILQSDAEGFGEIARVSKSEPGTNLVYLEAGLKNFYRTERGMELLFELPFDRFFMQEHQAPVAERIYNEAALDSSRNTYALVSIRAGGAILQDVLIDGVPLGDLAQRTLESEDAARKKHTDE